MACSPTSVRTQDQIDRAIAGSIRERLQRDDTEKITNGRERPEHQDVKEAALEPQSASEGAEKVDFEVRGMSSSLLNHRTSVTNQDCQRIRIFKGWRRIRFLLIPLEKD
jgi:hypothetical protein